MTSYAVGYLTHINMGPEIIAYLNAIDATLTPFGGKFVIHGGDKEHLEGAWPGDLIVISFPDRCAARAWYASPEYQVILPLRTRNARGDVILIDGVGSAHLATDVLAIT